MDNKRRRGRADPSAKRRDDPSNTGPATAGTRLPSLRDELGEWCAWCLEYVVGKSKGWWARERHHAWSKANLAATVLWPDGQLLQTNFPEPWILVAHQGCHRRIKESGDLQDVADAAATKLRLLRSREPFQPDAFDLASKRAHDAGNYYEAILINQLLRTRLAGEGEPLVGTASLQAIDYQLASLAGVWGEPPVDLRSFASGRSVSRPLALLHVANHLSNRGNIREARYYLERGQALAKTQHLDLYLDLSLRHAQIDRREVYAKEAYRLAESDGDPYRVHTSRVIWGMLALAELKPEAEDHFRAVSNATSTSWLYRAEAYFGLGCVYLLRNDLRPAYRLLVRADYIYHSLALQPLFHPVCLPRNPTVKSTRPADLIRSAFPDIGSDERVRLRKKSIIGSGVRDKLMWQFAGYAGGEDWVIADV